MSGRVDLAVFKKRMSSQREKTQVGTKYKKKASGGSETTFGLISSVPAYLKADLPFDSCFLRIFFFLFLLYWYCIMIFLSFLNSSFLKFINSD